MYGETTKIMHIHISGCCMQGEELSGSGTYTSMNSEIIHIHTASYRVILYTPSQMIFLTYGGPMHERWWFLTKIVLTARY